MKEVNGNVKQVDLSTVQNQLVFRMELRKQNFLEINKKGELASYLSGMKAMAVVCCKSLEKDAELLNLERIGVTESDAGGVN